MAKTILTAAERIEGKFGGKWRKAGGGIIKPPPAISTGSLLLDEAIGTCKGYPEGAVIEAYGPQHSGKTLMGYLAIAASQRAHSDREHLIIDAENQFKFQAEWAQQVGVDVANLYVKPVTSAEETFDIIEMAILGDVELDKDGNVKKVIKAGNFGVIMVDSVTQLVPLEMIHKSMNDSQRMAALAAVMSRGLKKITSAMVVANSKTILFFVNQLRSDPSKMFGSKETRTGGNALGFYNTISFRVSKISKSEERDEKGKIFAHRVRLKFDKNKAGQLPDKPIEFRLRYDGTGIDNDDELFTVGEMNGLIAKVKRGKYNFVKPNTDEELLDESIENFKKDELNSILEKHPEMKERILNFISEGKFYTDKEISKDIDDDEIDKDDANKKDNEGWIAESEKNDKPKRRRRTEDK